MPPPDPMLFRCEVSRDGNTARAQLHGELDMATVPLLRGELAGLRENGVRCVVLDLSRLSFLDSTGLRCILDCHTEAQMDGFSLALVPGSPTVQRVFEITGTEAHLPFTAL